MNYSWFILALISSVLFSFMVLLMKVATKSFSGQQIMFYLYVFGLIILLGYFTITGNKFLVGAKDLPIFFGIAILSVVANVMLIMAYGQSENAAYPDAIMSSRVLLILVLSMVLLGAKFNFVGVVGSILVVAGVVLLSFV